MSFIINEKYNKTKRPYFFFITNRLLRIYPIYWVILLLTVIYNVSIHHTLFFSHTDLLHRIIDCIKNVTLIISPELFVHADLFHNGFYVGQAWTLGIELIFFLFAPFIVQRNIRVILFILILAFLARTLIWHSNIYPQFDSDYYFIPNFIYFILGILAYKLKNVLPYDALPSTMRISTVIMIILFTLLFSFLPELHHIKQWLFYLLLTLCIPILFEFKSFVNFDLLGNISYPIYIGHFLTLTIIVNTFHIKSSFIAIITVILFAILLHYFVEKPVNILRASRIRKV